MTKEEANTYFEEMWEDYESGEISGSDVIEAFENWIYTTLENT